FSLAKGVNVALGGLAAVVVFVWMRRAVSAPYALLAAVLVLLVPGLVYSTMLMTENAFLPAFLLATFAIALALERPTLRRQGMALAAIALAAGVRYQGLVLVAVLPAAILLNAVFAMRASRSGRDLRLIAAELRRWLPSAAALAGTVLAYVVYKRVRGEPLSSGLGAYRSVAEADYSLWQARAVIVDHLAELALSVGVVPVSALLVLVGLALTRGRSISPVERAFVAVALPAIVAITVVAGLFSWRNTLGIMERYTFYGTPVLVCALVLWLAKGLPRPLLTTAVALLVPVGLVLAFELPAYVSNSPYNAFTLFLLFRLSEHFAGDLGDVAIAVGVATTFAAAAFALLHRRAAVLVLPAFVAVLFAAVSLPVFDALRLQARQLRYVPGVGDDAGWIEKAIGKENEATFLFSAGESVWQSSVVMLQAGFWNPNVETVANVGEREVCPLPERDAAIDETTREVRSVGTGEPLRARYIVADRSLALAARRLAERPPLAVWRLESPARVVGKAEGLYGDGWMGADARYVHYVARRKGRVAVRVSRTAWQGEDVPGRVEIVVGPLGRGPGGRPELRRVTARRRWTIHSGAEKRFLLPTPRRPYGVHVHIEPTFSPATFGIPDTRQLGAQVTFRALP
ncbi:MAG: hypothetical protein M3M94_07705, partial [Actinomycetota bacterium]|nr:hypothetical protein [Actinomycetota bacterium]